VLPWSAAIVWHETAPATDQPRRRCRPLWPLPKGKGTPLSAPAKSRCRRGHGRRRRGPGRARHRGLHHRHLAGRRGEYCAKYDCVDQAASIAREQLSNLAGVWLDRRPLPMPPAIVAALRDPPANAPSEGRTLRLADPELCAPWLDYAEQRLRVDQDVRFAE
jgi:hypothetical protein